MPLVACRSARTRRSGFRRADTSSRRCVKTSASTPSGTKPRVEHRDIGASLSPFNAPWPLQGPRRRHRAWRHRPQRRDRGRLAGEPPARVGALRRAPLLPLPAAGAALYHARRVGGRLGVKGGSSGRRLHRSARDDQPPGEHRRRQDLVIHPASTPPPAARRALEAGGVGADLIRLSVGIEDVDDIIWDLRSGAGRLGQGGLEMGDSTANTQASGPTIATEVAGSPAAGSRPPSSAPGHHRPTRTARWWVPRRQVALGLLPPTCCPRRPTSTCTSSTPGARDSRPSGVPPLADLLVTPDLVDVFRRPEDLPEVAQEAISAGRQGVLGAARPLVRRGRGAGARRRARRGHEPLPQDRASPASTGASTWPASTPGVISGLDATVAEQIHPGAALLLLRHAVGLARRRCGISSAAGPAG